MSKTTTSRYASTMTSTIAVHSSPENPATSATTARKIASTTNRGPNTRRLTAR